MNIRNPKSKEPVNGVDGSMIKRKLNKNGKYIKIPNIF